MFKLLISLMLFFLLSAVHAWGDSLYTWEDSEGNLHVTDERPPAGAKIVRTDKVSIKSGEELRRDMLERERQQAEEQSRRRAAAPEPPAVETTPVPPAEVTEDEQKAREELKEKIRKSRKERKKRYLRAKENSLEGMVDDIL